MFSRLAANHPKKLDINEKKDKKVKIKQIYFHIFNRQSGFTFIYLLYLVYT